MEVIPSMLKVEKVDMAVEYFNTVHCKWPAPLGYLMPVNNVAVLSDTNDVPKSAWKQPVIF